MFTLMKECELVMFKKWLKNKANLIKAFKCMH